MNLVTRAVVGLLGHRELLVCDFGYVLNVFFFFTALARYKIYNLWSLAKNLFVTSIFGIMLNEQLMSNNEPSYHLR